MARRRRRVRIAGIRRVQHSTHGHLHALVEPLRQLLLVDVRVQREERARPRTLELVRPAPEIRDRVLHPLIEPVEELVQTLYRRHVSGRGRPVGSLHQHRVGRLGVGLRTAGCIGVVGEFRQHLENVVAQLVERIAVGLRRAPVRVAPVNQVLAVQLVHERITLRQLAPRFSDRLVVPAGDAARVGHRVHRRPGVRRCGMNRALTAGNSVHRRVSVVDDLGVVPQHRTRPRVRVETPRPRDLHLPMGPGTGKLRPPRRIDPLHARAGPSSLGPRARVDIEPGDARRVLARVHHLHGLDVEQAPAVVALRIETLECRDLQSERTGCCGGGSPCRRTAFGLESAVRPHRCEQRDDRSRQVAVIRPGFAGRAHPSRPETRGTRRPCNDGRRSPTTSAAALTCGASNSGAAHARSNAPYPGGQATSLP